ncbi:hypothetical protein ABH941_007439 [Streptacidiphilus sp. EB103A]
MLPDTGRLRVAVSAAMGAVVHSRRHDGQRLIAAPHNTARSAPREHPERGGPTRAAKHVTEVPVHSTGTSGAWRQERPRGCAPGSVTGTPPSVAVEPPPGQVHSPGRPTGLPVDGSRDETFGLTVVQTVTAAPLVERVSLTHARRSRRRLPDPDEPVYAALAEQWRHQGRTVPGEHDWEWIELTTRRIWHRPVREAVPQPEAGTRDLRGQVGKQPSLAAPSTTLR